MRNREITHEDAAPIDPLINVPPPLDALTPALLNEATLQRPTNGRTRKRRNPLTQFATDEFDSAIDRMNLTELHKLSVGPHEVLLRSQVVDLVRTVRKGKHAQRSLESNHNNGRTQSLALIVEEGKAAESQLTDSNQGLVTKVAARYIGKGIDFDDLIQEGNLGLLKAIERFDQNRGTEFSTYAVWWIRQKVSNAVKDKSRTGRIPRDALQEMQKIYKMESQLTQELGHGPTFDELADKLGLPTQDEDGGEARKRLRWKMQKTQSILSLDEPIDGDVSESTQAEFIEDKSTPSPAAPMEASELRDIVTDILDQLPPREAQVLRLRFGLRGNGEKDSHLLEIGQKFGFSGENARLVENAGLNKIRRRPDWRRKLRDFLRED